MNNPRNPWELLQEHCPHLAASLSASVETILATSGLDEKTKQLIYIAVQTAVNYPLAVKYHVPLAQKAGASDREIIGAAFIAAAAAGPGGFVSGFPALVEELKHGE
jgi:alkylhydroperoxidase/carboxymuconolactone decarboxylase family protein YurZ